jgi:hypothetical protein
MPRTARRLKPGAATRLASRAIAASKISNISLMFDGTPMRKI